MHENLMHAPKGWLFYMLLSYYLYVLHTKNVLWAIGIIFEQTLQRRDYGHNFSVIISGIFLLHYITQWPPPTEKRTVDFPEIVSSPEELQLATITEGSFAWGLVRRTRDKLLKSYNGKWSRASPSNSRQNLF